MRRESGQVAVEAALVLPIWLLLALGAIQLALIQQAKLITEYAAFSAARAGVVWSGNNERMRDAALLAVLPSFGATPTLEALGRTYQRARSFDAKVHEAIAAETRDAPVALKQSGLLGLVRIHVVSPEGFDAPELDFDSADTFDEDTDHRHSYERFLSGDLDPGQEATRDATVLTVRVRYLYELRIPFANHAILASWLATATNGFGPTRLSAEDRAFITTTAAGEGAFAPGRRFFLPLTATWSQRLQSNFHHKWLTSAEEPR